ncbi:radical SAM protein [Megasphaera sp. WILCCON 0056]|uniref:radical SAM protein n=1 Tax=Megasphaera sp. WILCCON 0056 TaxID=3345340 RepID=UPI003A80EBEC
MAESRPLVFNVQKFSVHDGPGIRTTIFFKGCPLACPWCHNPESQHFEAETMAHSDGGQDDVGTYYPVSELVRQAAQDQIFYERSGGGVTLSGGEVMAQPMAYVGALVRALQEQGISVGIDTSGAVPFEAFEEVLPYTDFFLYDMKLFDDQRHRQYMGCGNERILENLKRLSDVGAVLYLRLIMVDGVNADRDRDIRPFQDWLQARQIRVERIHLLPYHELGRHKYEALQRPFQPFRAPPAQALEAIRQSFVVLGYDTVIGG